MSHSQQLNWSMRMSKLHQHIASTNVTRAMPFIAFHIKPTYIAFTPTPHTLALYVFFTRRNVVSALLFFPHFLVSHSPFQQPLSLSSPTPESISMNPTATHNSHTPLNRFFPTFHFLFSFATYLS